MGLGRALQNKIRISCVGIRDASGAHTEMREIISHAERLCEEYKRTGSTTHEIQDKDSKNKNKSEKETTTSTDVDLTPAKKAKKVKKQKKKQHGVSLSSTAKSFTPNANFNSSSAMFIPSYPYYYAFHQQTVPYGDYNPNSYGAAIT